MKKRAFTLVELLVVIGIIAILISILIPALSRSRESANRTACLSNLRQVHLSFAIYAGDNRDRVPLGYRTGKKQFNSMIYSGTAGRFVLFGLLYPARSMQQPKVFFCPSESDPRSTFNNELNPWPPGPEGDPKKNIAAGYGCRPEVELPDDPSTSPDVPMPRLTQFRGRAIFADLTATPLRVETRHRIGVNVLYGDGSANWIARERFNADLAKCPAIAAPANEFQDAIWAEFDRR